MYIITTDCSANETAVPAAIPASASGDQISGISTARLTTSVTIDNTSGVTVSCSA